MQHEQNGMNDYTRLLVKKILYCVSMMCLAAFLPPPLICLTVMLRNSATSHFVVLGGLNFFQGLCTFQRIYSWVDRLHQWPDWSDRVQGHRMTNTYLSLTSWPKICRQLTYSNGVSGGIQINNCN